MLTKATHTDLHALLQEMENHSWCLADLTEKGRSMPLTDPHTIVPTAHEPWGLIAGQDLGAAYVVLLIVDHGMILEIGTLDRTLYSDPWARLTAARQGEPLLDGGTAGRDRPRRSLARSARRVLCFGQGVPLPRSSRSVYHCLVVICGFFFNTHYHGCSPSLIISPGPVRGEIGRDNVSGTDSGTLVEKSRFRFLTHFGRITIVRQWVTRSAGSPGNWVCRVRPRDATFGVRPRIVNAA